MAPSCQFIRSWLFGASVAGGSSPHRQAWRADLADPTEHLLYADRDGRHVCARARLRRPAGRGPTRDVAVPRRFGCHLLRASRGNLARAAATTGAPSRVHVGGRHANSARSFRVSFRDPGQGRHIASRVGRRARRRTAWSRDTRNARLDAQSADPGNLPNADGAFPSAPRVVEPELRELLRRGVLAQALVQG